MNRNVVIGGFAAVLLLLVAATYLVFFNGRSSTTGSDQANLQDQGPVTLNPVAVITEHSANQSEDGRRLTLGFTNFELLAKAGETTSAVFSTTWRLKVGPDDRVVVAAATLNGFMKSAGTPPPAPAPAPVTVPPATAPVDPAAVTPPAPAAPAEQPVQPATPSAPAPVAGDGVARVIVALGSEATVTEWRDAAGTGADRKVSKAISYAGASADLRNGGTIPVTITVELSGGASAETLAKLNSIELQLFVESAPVPPPVAEPVPATPPPAIDTGLTPAPTPPPAADAPVPATP
ncbi:MAG: hypothetical protein SGJ03_01210 [Alphaproteobacteria bacterium]|nr:hypothetical protein [Alphaproteobacteria bacterium]